MKKAIILAAVGALCVTVALVVVLVLVQTEWIRQQGQLRCQQITLNLSKDSVDDQYIGCKPERERELMNSGKIPLPTTYHETWKRAREHWAQVAQNVRHLNSIYGIAIVAYTINDSRLYSDFNTAARGAGKSQGSYDQYPFKDFHLLLTKALQAKTSSSCREVFRGVKGICFNTSEKAVVRFGQFASSSRNKKVAEDFGQDTFFSITTCYGVPIDDISNNKNQEEVLIPPYEMFSVTNYTKTQKGIFIRLVSRRVISRFNCEVLKEPQAS